MNPWVFLLTTALQSRLGCCSQQNSVSVSKCSYAPRRRVRSREEIRSQGQTVVKDRFSPQQSPTILSDKQSIQEVTHESPRHNSHVATLKLQGPPNFPWKVYKHCISKKLERTTSKDSLCNNLLILHATQVLKQPLNRQCHHLSIFYIS